MGKRIFISTNYDRLRNVIGEQRNQKGINLLNHNNLLYWNADNNSFGADATETNLFLVKDEVKFNNNTFDTFDTLNGIQIQDTDYLMRHSRYTHRINDFGNRIHSDGEHEQGDTFYTTVFNFIFDNDNNKAQRIIEFLFPTAEAILGKKIDLLHSLLVPPANFTDAKAKWEDIKKTVEEANKNRSDDEKLSLATDGNALTSFETSVSNITGTFDKPYLEALTALRDKLLV